MNKKIKFLGPVLCGAIVASNLAFSSVQAAPIKSNIQNSNNTITNKLYASNNFTCDAYVRNGNVYINMNSNYSSALYEVIINFYDENGRDVDKFQHRERSSSGMSYGCGTDKHWTYAVVHFYANGDSVGSKTVYK